MILADRIHSVSHVKARMAEILDELPVSKEPIVITQNGEGRAVMLDLRTYEQTQETLAMLKLIAIGDAEAAAGKTHDARDVLAQLRADAADPA